MILLLGVLDDPVMAYVSTRLSATDDRFLLLDPRLYPERFHLSWSAQSGRWEGSIRYGAQQESLADLRSVYVRRLGVRDSFREEKEPGQQLAQDEAEWSLGTFLEAVPALVVNRPSVSASNACKPYQQQLIARHGFRVPRTLVTTVPEEARRFYEECRGRVIYKSISQHRSIVRRMTPEDLERLERVSGCPTQFQEYVPGVEVRVHTVGTRLFATEITTDAVDYRYAGLEDATRDMRAVKLPDDVAERCLRLAAGLGMALAGIDLRRNPEGQYYCFEVNPSPVFTFYQMQTGQRIGDALVDLLQRGEA